MRKIFKNVALATATITTVATPLILSSCTCHMPKEEPRLTSINVTLPETKIVLEAGEV
ncbi:MAG: hypothetical protein MJ233_05375 [Mycoplasmoidaceae bacterium]|nr:hypothetical protein [Mycoplasmoidaceae bacterium]